jgi:excisionase family DNA binding protein
MAQKYYSAEQAAEILGVDPAEVTAMQQQRQLRGYRDGANWKFKAEEVDELAAQRRGGDAPPDELPDDEGDVLLSEVELGASDAGLSGSVIGGDTKRGSSADSDLALAAESGVELGAEDAGSEPASGMDELDLTLEEDVSLDDSQLGESVEGGSTIDLSGQDLEDDDLVLGGSGTGSDITIGGDSGISLVDPTDSGLSLSEPLELGESDSSSSLQLGEDDMISLGEETDTDAPTELKTDDDFLLTPLEEAGDDESESGSQVIALEPEGEGDEAATMIAGGGAGGMAGILEEDFDTQPGADFGAGAMGTQPGAMAQGTAFAQPGAVLPEAPYSIWNVLSLALCVIVLIFGGWFAYDLLRNMWSWGGTYEVTSPMMDWVLSLFEG